MRLAGSVFAVVVVVLCGRLAGEVPPPARVHTITVARVGSQADADLVASKLELQGFGPVWQSEGEGGIAVRFGRFDTNSEAWAISQQMSRVRFSEREGGGT